MAVKTRAPTEAAAMQTVRALCSLSTRTNSALSSPSSTHLLRVSTTGDWGDGTGGDHLDPGQVRRLAAASLPVMTAVKLASLTASPSPRPGPSGTIRMASTGQTSAQMPQPLQ